MIWGLVRLEYLEIIAHAYEMVYDMGVQNIRPRALSSVDGERGLALD